jgi:hypothetical protein
LQNACKRITKQLRTLGSTGAIRRYRQLRGDIGLRQRGLNTAGYGFCVLSTLAKV